MAFAQAHDEVVETPPRSANLHRFGGSHAQRDVLLRTLLESVFLGHHEFAAELISERLAEREKSVYGWTHRQQLLVGVSDDVSALGCGRAGRRPLGSHFAAA